VAWAVVVAASGGLTLWLQDSAEPPPRARWEEQRTPAPVLSAYVCPTQYDDYVVCTRSTIR
jgi:hypothetical protein